MAYRGYWQLNCAELANTNRVIDHLTGQGCAHCRNLRVPYDDSWPGLTYAIEPPWFSESVPASAEFVGIWVMNVVGLDTVPVQRDIANLICSGGAATPHRDAFREIEFEALVVACTNRGARFGLNWLACHLRAGANRGGVELNFYNAHPEEMTEDPDTLWRSVRGTVLTQNAQVIEYAGLGGSQRNRQASVYRVNWKLAALNPYVYSRPVDHQVIWDSTSTQPIEWVHAPDCVSPESCKLPVLFAAGCEPVRLDLSPAVVPRCGGCMPLCDIEVRRWTIAPDESALPSCETTTASMRVTNSSEEQLTLNTYWEPTDSVDPCDRINAMQINGLERYATIVADSIGGRPYAIVNGVRTRQVGVVTTPSGMPWSGAVLDRSVSWDLVVESPPGADFDMTVTFCERDS